MHVWSICTDLPESPTVRTLSLLFADPTVGHLQVFKATIKKGQSNTQRGGGGGRGVGGCVCSGLGIGIDWAITCM